MQTRLTRRLSFTLFEVLVVITVIVVLGAVTATFFHDGWNACRFAAQRMEDNDATLRLRREWRGFVHENGAPFLCTAERVVFKDGRFVACAGNRIQFDYGGGRRHEYALAKNCRASAVYADDVVGKRVVLTVAWQRPNGGGEVAANRVRLVACPPADAKEAAR